MRKCRYRVNDKPEPFLRWAGGKRWLAKIISKSISEACTGRYIEPFLGGGAMFFSVRPKRALLSDLNADLINTYTHVKNNPSGLISELKKLDCNKETYYSLRSKIPRTAFQSAVRFLYLNRCCYGGLYRENKQGKFNVPYGGGSRNHLPLWEKDLLKKASSLLTPRSVIVRNSDFRHILKSAGKGDVVFCDPTYKSSSRKQFDRYGSTVFNWSDQVELAKLSRAAARKGAMVIVSNIFCEDVSALYPTASKYILSRTRSLGKHVNVNECRAEHLFILDSKFRHLHWNQLVEFSVDSGNKECLKRNS